jgi:hypothetical protein
MAEPAGHVLGDGGHRVVVEVTEGPVALDVNVVKLSFIATDGEAKIS